MRERYFDGLAVIRAQDNYVVQWGDPDGEDTAKARALLDGRSGLDVLLMHGLGDWITDPRKTKQIARNEFPKSVRWRARARVGERLQWWQDVDEREAVYW